MMIELFFYSAIIACLSAFAVTLMHKWGFVEHMQVNADAFPEIINKLFNCNFCLSWWSSVIICIFFIMFTCDYQLAICPFVATPVAKFLLQ